MFERTLAVLASVSLLIGAANAQPRGGLMAAAEMLELTDQQIEKLQDLQYQHQKEMIGLRAAVKSAKLDLKELMRKADVSEKAALALQEKVLQARAEVARAALKHKLAARKILTADQLGKWQKMQRGKDHGMRKGMRHDGCPGPGMGGPGMMGPGMGHGPGMGMNPDTSQP